MPWTAPLLFFWIFCWFGKDLGTKKGGLRSECCLHTALGTVWDYYKTRSHSQRFDPDDHMSENMICILVFCPNLRQPLWAFCMFLTSWGLQLSSRALRPFQRSIKSNYFWTILSNKICLNLKGIAVPDKAIDLSSLEAECPNLLELWKKIRKWLREKEHIKSGKINNFGCG